MKITENSANESELAVQFKTLAIEIFKTLSLPEELREGLGIDYLNKVYTRCINLVENSEILNPMNEKSNFLILTLNWFATIRRRRLCRPMRVQTL